MSLFDREELEDLVEYGGSRPCISIFLPTHRAGLDWKQDPIRLKNLLREAEEKLSEHDVAAERIEELLEPARLLLPDDDFWKHQSDGLAVFLAGKGMRNYRLPRRFDELVLVQDRFYVKPLLPLLSGDGRFHLLAMSQNQVRLFEGTRDGLREIDLADIPESLRDAVGYDWQERSLQFHTGAGPSGGGSPTGRSRQAIFHGHGEPEDDAKEEIEVFFRAVDEGVRGLIDDLHEPLLVAAVDYERALYRKVSKHPHLLEEGISGNPERVHVNDLHERAWEIVEPVFRAEVEHAAERYEELASAGKVNSNPKEIVPAAVDGRVDTLFIPRGQRLWGRYDEETRTVTLNDGEAPGIVDLFDSAAVKTLTQGGTVYSVNDEEIPGVGPMAAIYRY